MKPPRDSAAPGTLVRPWHILRVATALGVLALGVPEAQAQFSLTGTTYTQDFNGLGTASLTGFTDLDGGTPSNYFGHIGELVSPGMSGWYYNEAGTAGAVNNTITAGTGSSNAGDMYNIGLSGDADRKLGSLQSGTNVPTFGFLFTNNTGSTITDLAISYTGETWRVGTGTRSDRLDFGYQPGASNLTSGTWTNFDSLDYANPGQATGNGSVQHTASLSSTITGLGIASGASFFIRWASVDASGADDLLGIDNFSLTATLLAAGTTFYWDANGATAGAGGATPAGTWGTDAFWNTSSAGTAATAAWTTGGDAIFSAGTDASGSYAVSVTGTQSVGSILFEEGTVTLGGLGTLDFSDATPTVTVDAASAIINSTITGSNGLTKLGTGTLTLGGTNLFTGNVAISAGALAIDSDARLGTAANDITLNGRLATSATFGLAAGRDFSGSGTLDVANGTILTVNGNVAMSGLTLNNTGTTNLQGATNSVGALGITANTTLQGNAVTLTGITASHTGTATVSNSLDFGALDKTVNVSDAGATLSLTGSLTGTGTGRLIKTGAGTLEVTQDNAATLTGMRLGASGASPTNGGTLKIGHQNALGNAANQFQFNYGTLQATGAFTGANAVANALSIGGRSGAEAVIAGSDVDFTGAVSFFRGTGTSGELVLKVNNTSTMSGTFGGVSGFGDASGITLGGTGKLIVSGDWSSNVDQLTVADDLTLQADSTVGGNVIVGDGDATGGTTPVLQGSGTLVGDVTVNSDGTLRVGPSSGGTAQDLELGGSLSSSGTLEFDIFTRTAGSNPIANNDLLKFTGTLGTETVSLGGTLTLTDLTGGDSTLWAAGDAWQIIDWGTIALGNRSISLTAPTLPGLGANLEWSLSALGTTGVISIAAVSGTSGTYWDTNGNTAGSGLAASGNWSESKWSSSAAGTVATGNFSDGGTPIFSAGTDATGAYTVTVDTAVNANGLTFEEGNVTLAAGSGTLTLTSATVSVASGTTATISEPLLGLAGLNKTSAGTLVLIGDHTYSGGTTVTAGTLQLGDGTTNGSVAGNLTNNAALVFNNGSAQSFGGNISGTGTLTKNGAGVLTLGGTNSYNGGTTVSAGGLTGTTSSLQGAITNNAAVTFDQATDGTYAGDMSGTGSLTKTGAGVMILSGTNSYNGGTTVSAGGLVGTTGSLQGNITNDAAVTFDQGTSGTYAGNMSGTGSLTKTGAGVVALSGNNGYAGGTVLSGGTLVAASNTALGTAAVAATNGTLYAASGVTVANDITAGGTAGGFIISEYVEGSSFNKYIELHNGTSGTLDLSLYQLALYANGAATATSTVTLSSLTSGPTTLASGATLVLQNSGAVLTLPGGVTSFSSGVVNHNGDDALALQLADGTNIDIFGVIGSDPGTAWTVSGNTTLDKTLVRAASVTSGVATNPVGTDAAAFTTLGTEWNQFNQNTVSNLGSHTMNAGGTVTLGMDTVGSATFSGVLTLVGDVALTAAASGTVTFSGKISGAAGNDITKTGAGTVVLSNNTSDYDGSTFVHEGTLQVGSGSNGKTGTGAVSVNGTSAVLAGTGTVQGAATVTQGQIKPGDAGGSDIGTLTFSNGLTFGPAASLATVATLSISGTTTSNEANDQIVITGALTLNDKSQIVIEPSSFLGVEGQSFNLFDWTAPGALTANGWDPGSNRNGAGDELSLFDLPTLTGTLYWDVSRFLSHGEISIAPEPSRALLLLAGMGAMLMRRRRPAEPFDQ